LNREDPNAVTTHEPPHAGEKVEEEALRVGHLTRRIQTPGNASHHTRRGGRRSTEWRRAWYAAETRCAGRKSP
jgi:hypothetical protein